MNHSDSSTIFLNVKTLKVLDSYYTVDQPDECAACLVQFLSCARRACGFQNLVGASVYGGHNLLTPGWNRVEVAAKTWWGPVLMSLCPQARLCDYLNANAKSPQEK
jgi:hypothetical protein